MLDWVKKIVEESGGGTFPLIILPVLVAIAGFIHVRKSKKKS